MLRQKTLVLVLAAACSSTMLYAAPFASIFHKDKSTATTSSSSAGVNVDFNNTAEYPRQIKVGSKVKTLASHKVTHITIPAGTSVTVYSSMKTHNPGDVLVVVDASKPNQTINVD
ncbi:MULTISPECIES: hypothetical protein [Acidobacteriaceae]|uniref:hypothetical protein n=1 Tax=Acidobacteriaceae TaxID=204434 RepID=UPI00131A612E|nr:MULTISPECIES: hypothetical protein [Acidobacteriaceae]MDW5265832.1 hypothetical protein [Edaphobacter sp.]